MTLDQEVLALVEPDLERIAQALLLHVALKLPLQEKGRVCLRLAREDEAFRSRLEQALARLSREDRFGITRMSPAQVEHVRALYTPVRV